MSFVSWTHKTGHPKRMLNSVFGEDGEQNPLGREASNKAARFRSPKLAITIYLGSQDVKRFQDSYVLI